LVEYLLGEEGRSLVVGFDFNFTSSTLLLAGHLTINLEAGGFDNYIYFNNPGTNIPRWSSWKELHTYCSCTLLLGSHGMPQMYVDAPKHFQWKQFVPM